MTEDPRDTDRLLATSDIYTDLRCLLDRCYRWVHMQQDAFPVITCHIPSEIHRPHIGIPSTQVIKLHHRLYPSSRPGDILRPSRNQYPRYGHDHFPDLPG